MHVCVPFPNFQFPQRAAPYLLVSTSMRHVSKDRAMGITGRMSYCTRLKDTGALNTAIIVFTQHPSCGVPHHVWRSRHV